MRKAFDTLGTGWIPSAQTTHIQREVAASCIVERSQGMGKTLSVLLLYTLKMMLKKYHSPKYNTSLVFCPRKPDGGSDAPSAEARATTVCLRREARIETDFRAALHSTVAGVETLAEKTFDIESSPGSATLSTLSTGTLQLLQNRSVLEMPLEFELFLR